MKQMVIIIMTAMFSMNAMAQNAVDRMVEEFSSVGQARFTSAIERNPQTREVVKVVKTLRVGSPNDRTLRRGFLNESKHHDSTTSVNNGHKSVIFSEETNDAARVYMLKYDDDYAEVTIIVNRKKTTK